MYTPDTPDGNVIDGILREDVPILEIVKFWDDDWETTTFPNETVDAPFVKADPDDVDTDMTGWTFTLPERLSTSLGFEGSLEGILNDPVYDPVEDDNNWTTTCVEDPGATLDDPDDTIEYPAPEIERDPMFKLEFPLFVIVIVCWEGVPGVVGLRVTVDPFDNDDPPDDKAIWGAAAFPVNSIENGLFDGSLFVIVIGELNDPADEGE